MPDRVDQYESMFRAASKRSFRYQPIQVERALIISDQNDAEAEAFEQRVKQGLNVLSDEASPVQWTTLRGDQFSTIGELLEQVETADPHIVCTYRQLHSKSRRWPYTLGEYLDVLTQCLEPPVMVFPRPDAPDLGGLKSTANVMVITDHLVGDSRLVNWGLRFVARNGTLHVGHIEDDSVFDRYLDIIGKISEIDTDVARTQIHDRLLKEPRDYVQSIEAGLKKHHPDLSVESVITLGHHLAEYRRLVKAEEVDLLVMNTKQDDQLAMHGLAYPLAIEMREIPLLMI